MIKKYEEFVSKLQTATDKRTIAWEKASGNDEYQAMIGKNSVSIKYYPAMDLFLTGGESNPYVSLQIQNMYGEKIDDVSAKNTDLDYSVLHKLYESARRSCNKVEEALDEMMKVLENGNK